MRNHRCKAVFITMLLMMLAPMTMLGQQESGDHKKFLGVWNRTNTHASPNALFGDIKVTESDGKIYVQLKTANEGIKKAEAQIKNGVLLWGYTDEISYGKWKLGARWQGEYRPDLIVVCHSDGSYGSNGDCTGKYPNYRHGAVADKEVEYRSFMAEIKDGDMLVHNKLGSDYCKGDTPLFYQSSNWNIYDSYTNW